MAIQLDPNKPQTGATPNVNDFTQFAALRRGAGANDPAALRAAARQFESLFTKMMLEGMRKASFGDPMFGSDQGDMYQGMMDDQMAVQLSAGRGLGLADMLIRQLSHGAMSATTGPDIQSSDQTTSKVDDAQRAKFVEEILPHATAAARELGVDPRALIAQAALETGWGTKQPADASGASNNMFGIKASGWQGASVDSDTQEYVAGVASTERGSFRSYRNVAESVQDYVSVLRDNPRYAAALNTGSDVRAFATALQRGGYATDPAYADKLMAVAAQLGLAANVNSFKSDGAAPIANAEPSRKNHA
jgi:flagellar protein FlgJ